MNKKITTIVSLIAVFGCITIAFTSCENKDKNSPGVEFMPDMYRSPSLESNMAYVDMNTGDTLQANRMPVAGTIARGYMPYAYQIITYLQAQLIVLVLVVFIEDRYTSLLAFNLSQIKFLHRFLYHKIILIRLTHQLKSVSIFPLRRGQGG